MNKAWSHLIKTIGIMLIYYSFSTPPPNPTPRDDTCASFRANVFMVFRKPVFIVFRKLVFMVFRKLVFIVFRKAVFMVFRKPVFIVFRKAVFMVFRKPVFKMLIRFDKVPEVLPFFNKYIFDQIFRGGKLTFSVMHEVLENPPNYWNETHLVNLFIHVIR